MWKSVGTYLPTLPPYATSRAGATERGTRSQHTPRRGPPFIITLGVFQTANVRARLGSPCGEPELLEESR